MSNKIQPNCRYGHGDLIMVDEKGEHPKWGLISQGGQGIIFSGCLYVCKTCGYTELFDDDVELTKSRQSES